MKCTQLLFFAALGLTGCADNYWTSTVSRTESLSDNQVLLTTADLRSVSRSPRNGSSIFCVEPSPDVAKIANASFSGDLGLSAEAIGNFASPELALALAAARAEGLTQLGQRLATIQLLRDGLYRACEAYANQAIGKENYVMMLSRYDDIMITMLLAEFGAQAAQSSPLAQLAGLSLAGGGAAVGPGSGAEVAIKDWFETRTRLSDKRVELAEAEVTLENAKKSEETDKVKEQKDAVENLKKEEKIIEEEVAEKTEQLERIQAAAASGVALAATEAENARSARRSSDTAAIAAAMVMMQQAYLDDFNLDSIVAGCLTALASDVGRQAFQNSPPTLAEVCREHVQGDLLQMMAAVKAADVLEKAGPDPVQTLRRVRELASELKKMLPPEGEIATQSTGGAILASGQTR